MMSPMARVVSLTLLTVLIVFLGITFFHVVAPFLLPLFLAGVIAILCQPVFRYFVRRTNNRVRIAAALTTAAVLFVLLMPLLVGTLIASLQLYTLSVDKLSDTNWKEAGSQLESELIIRIRPYLPPDTDAQDVRQNIQQLLKALAGRSLGLAGTTLNKTLDVLGALVSLLIGMVMFVIALYYFLADGPARLRA
jgi:predicted PurR-regulated permease PerM